MFEALDFSNLCEQCDQEPCECEGWIMKNDCPEVISRLYPEGEEQYATES
jgi:hypothetical protein